MGFMKNKRRATRQDCLVPVDGKTGSAFENIRTVDVSKGGIGLVSKKRIPLKREIAVELDFSAEGEPVFAIGKVCWVKKIKGTDTYRIGLTFKDVLRGSKSRLNKYFQDV
jgi:c-di-GMP-binding flagellar brake protein YcgR